MKYGTLWHGASLPVWILKLQFSNLLKSHINHFVQEKNTDTWHNISFWNFFKKSYEYIKPVGVSTMQLLASQFGKDTRSNIAIYKNLLWDIEW